MVKGKLSDLCLKAFHGINTYKSLLCNIKLKYLDCCHSVITLRQFFNRSNETAFNFSTGNYYRNRQKINFYDNFRHCVLIDAGDKC